MSHRNEYEIIRESGRGGLGVVHQARHPHYDKLVALKEICPSYANSKEFRQRFLREIRAEQQLRHPHLVKTGLDHDEKELFYVMEFVDAPVLADCLDDDYVFSEQDTIAFGLQLAQALVYMHSKNIIHRDIKPDNAFLIDNKHIKLFDFSLSLEVGERSLCERGVFLGTPGYVAPEMIIQARDPSFADDIYGLGATLFTLCTGLVPFEDKGRELDCLSAQVNLDPPLANSFNPKLSLEFSQVINCMRARHEDDRYTTMAQVITSLRVLSRREKEAKV